MSNSKFMYGIGEVIFNEKTIGYIEKNWDDYIWKSINLPCECEDAENDPLGREVGDSLMGPHLGDNDLPERIRNDNKWLQSKKQLVIRGDGEHVWNALYQGHPSAQNGNLFKEPWWKPYRRSDFSFDVFDYACLSVDATFKKTETSDMVAMGLWCIRQNDVYLWKLVNKRMGFVETLDRIKRFCKEFPTIDELIIEDKANGSAIIDSLRYSDGIPPVLKPYHRLLLLVAFTYLTISVVTKRTILNGTVRKRTLTDLENSCCNIVDFRSLSMTTWSTKARRRSRASLN